MPRITSNRIPQLRLHKATGQGYARLNGKVHYPGEHDRAATRERYAALIAEWEAGGRRLPTKPYETTVVELAASFVRFAEPYYRQADGSPTREAADLRIALKPLRALYGRTNAADFGPKRLKAVRVRMIEKGWARTNVNSWSGRIKRMFRWGTEEELVPPRRLPRTAGGQRPDRLHSGPPASARAESERPVAPTKGARRECMSSP